MKIEDLAELLGDCSEYEKRYTDLFCADCGEKIEDWDIPYFVTGPVRVVCWRCAIRSRGYER